MQGAQFGSFLARPNGYHWSFRPGAQMRTLRKSGGTSAGCSQQNREVKEYCFLCRDAREDCLRQRQKTGHHSVSTCHLPPEDAAHQLWRSRKDVRGSLCPCSHRRHDPRDAPDTADAGAPCDSRTRAPRTRTPLAVPDRLSEPPGAFDLVDLAV